MNSMNKTINVILSVTLALFMVSCGQRTTKVTEDNMVQGNINIADSIVMEEAMGKVVERNYAGVIPAADTPGQELELEIMHQQYSSIGVYKLKRTYLEAHNGRDRSFESYGRFQTVLTSSYDILQLIPYSHGDDTLSFYIIGDSRLQMLDRDLNPIEDTEHNYDLVATIDF